MNGTGTTSDYTLDTIGNVTEEKRNSTTYRTATYSGQRLSTSTASGTTVTYLYDSQGNVDCIVRSSWASSSCPAVATGVTPTNELVSDNVYDYKDRLVAIRAYNSGTAGDKTEYRYDPLSRPTKKTATEAGTTTTTDLVYLGVSDAVVRETETGAATKDRTYAFDVLGERATLSEKITGSTSRWSYVDHPSAPPRSCSTKQTPSKPPTGTPPTATPTPRSPRPPAASPPTRTSTATPANAVDPAAKAYDMGARTYYPGIGRWFQQDHYPDALDNLGLSTDPLTANRYSFTAANPINYVELDGHVAVPVEYAIAVPVSIGDRLAEVQATIGAGCSGSYCKSGLARAATGAGRSRARRPRPSRRRGRGVAGNCNGYPRSLALKLRITVKQATVVLRQLVRAVNDAKVVSTAKLAERLQHLDNSALGRCAQAVGSLVIGVKASALAAVGRDCGQLLLAARSKGP